jgi:hypothetical protein
METARLTHDCRHFGECHAWSNSQVLCLGAVAIAADIDGHNQQSSYGYDEAAKA